MSLTSVPSSKCTVKDRSTHPELSKPSVKDGLLLSPTRRHYHFARFLHHEVPPLPPVLAAPSRLPLPSSGCPGRFYQLNDTSGKVKVILCVKQSDSDHGSVADDSLAKDGAGNPLSLNRFLGTMNAVPDHGSGSQAKCITIYGKRNQVILIDPTPVRRRGSAPVPKSFTFDAVHSTKSQMRDLCLLALTDTIRAVLRGQDGCILTIGHKRTGKTTSMLGSDQKSENLGVIPCAIAWLYRSLNQQRETLGTRFAIRVSAVELYGTEENFRDLLAGVASSEDTLSPSRCVQGTADHQFPQTALAQETGDSEPVASRFSKQLSLVSEIRASTMERAAYLLDTALATRSRSVKDQSDGLSHMLFTLHIYQCRVETSEDGTNVYGGRTKLHFLDLGCGRYANHPNGGRNFSSQNLEDTKCSPDSFSPLIGPRCSALDYSLTRSLSISGMASVILALLTGQRHLPYRDSALTHLLKEALTGNQMQPCILAHVESGVQYYTETLQVVQLVSKMGRLRRRRIGSVATVGSSAFEKSYQQVVSEDSASSSVDNLSDKNAIRHAKRRIRTPRLGRSSYARSISSTTLDMDFSSSSEQSCDTVIYLGQERRVRTSTSSQPFKLHLAKLGPRGNADGSVDVGTLSSGQMSEVESPSQTCSVNSRRLSSRSGEDDISAVSRSIKRMMPRTNATAWPRCVASRKMKSDMRNQDETWIDGPDMVDTMEYSQLFRNQTVSSSKTNRLNSTEQPVTCSNQANQRFSQQGVANRATSSTDQTDLMSSSHYTVLACHQIPQNFASGLQTTLKEKPSEQSDDRFKRELMTTELTAEGTRTANVVGSPGANEPNGGNRALSDISEHTEETDTVPDINTPGSSSSNSWADATCLLRTAPIWHMLNFYPKAASLENWDSSTGVDESLLPTSRNSGILETFEKNLSMNCISIPDSIVNTPKSPPKFYGDITSVRTSMVPTQSTSQHILDLLNKFPTPSQATTLTENKDCPAFLDGCGEQTVNMESFDSAAIDQQPKTEEVNRKADCLAKGTRTSELSSVSGSQAQSCLQLKHVGPARCESAYADLKDNCGLRELQKDCIRANDVALLRVAAWVNSIGTASDRNIQHNSDGQANLAVKHSFNRACKGPSGANFDETQYTSVGSPNITRPNVLQTPVEYHLLSELSPVDNNTARNKAQSSYFQPFALQPKGRYQQFAQAQINQGSQPSEFSNQFYPFVAGVDSLRNTYHKPGYHSAIMQTRKPSSTAIPPQCSAVPVKINKCVEPHDTTHRLVTEHCSRMINKANELDNTGSKFKRFKVFGFCTLPIFRNLRIWRAKKSKEKQHSNQFTLPTPSPTHHIGPIRAFSESPALRPPNRETDHDRINCNMISSFHDLSRVRPVITSTPTRPQLRRSCSSQTDWDTRNLPTKDPSSADSVQHIPQVHSVAVPVVERFVPPSINGQHDDLHQSSIRIQNELSGTHSTGPLCSLNYPSGLIASAPRSGRRSLGGGAASSGYESMRIGTSELSLSHPDSASDCSGRVSQNYLTKDGAKFRDRTWDLIRYSESSKHHPRKFKESNTTYGRTTYVNTVFGH